MPVDQRTHWNNVYSKDSNYFGNDPSAFGTGCAARMLSENVKRVLELGPGQGRDTGYFISRHMFVVAADYSERSCRDLKDKYFDAVSVLHTDLKDGIHIDEDSVDACYSHMLFTMDFKDSEIHQLMKDIARAVRKDGPVFISVRSKNDPLFQKGEHIEGDIWEDNGFAVRYYSEADIRSLLSDYEFENISEFKEGEKVLYGILIRNRK